MQQYLSSLFAALIALSICQHVCAMTHSWSTESTSLYSHLITKTFGMATGGIVSVDYKVENASINGTSYNVLVLINEGQRVGWYSSAGDDDLGGILCSYPSIQRVTVDGIGSVEWMVNSIDLYSVIAMQCKPSSGIVKAHYTVSMKNIRPDSNQFSYLSIDTVNLIRIFQGETMFYSLLLAGLCGQFFFRR